MRSWKTEKEVMERPSDERLGKREDRDPAKTRLMARVERARTSMASREDAAHLCDALTYTLSGDPSEAATRESERLDADPGILQSALERIVIPGLSIEHRYNRLYMQNLPPTMRIGETTFHLDRLLGRGGMGEAWLVHEDATEDDALMAEIMRVSGAPVRWRPKRQAVLKFVSSHAFRSADWSVSDDPADTIGLGARRAFEQFVAREIDGLDADNALCGCARVEAPGLQEEVMAMVMKLAPGDVLSKHVAEKREAVEEGKVEAHDRSPASWFKMAVAGRTLLRQLDRLHKQGIEHRDIKPSNVTYHDALPHQSRAFDFGLARAKADDVSNEQNRLIGTLQYTAPYQFSGRESPFGLRDLYATMKTIADALLLLKEHHGSALEIISRQLAGTYLSYEDPAAQPRMSSEAMRLSIEDVLARAPHSPGQEALVRLVDDILQPSSTWDDWMIHLATFDDPVAQREVDDRRQILSGIDTLEQRRALAQFSASLWEQGHGLTMERVIERMNEAVLLLAEESRGHADAFPALVAEDVRHETAEMIEAAWEQFDHWRTDQQEIGSVTTVLLQARRRLEEGDAVGADGLVREARMLMGEDLDAALDPEALAQAERELQRAMEEDEQGEQDKRNKQKLDQDAA